MNLDLTAIGATIRSRRTDAGLTQAELAERLNVTSQSVSLWERGQSLPDTALLPDLACILNCSVDMLLGGHSGSFRRRITVGDMQQAIGCIRRMRELLGADHFMYRTMVDALDARPTAPLKPPFPTKTPWTPMCARRCSPAWSRATTWMPMTSAATSATKKPAPSP